MNLVIQVLKPVFIVAALMVAAACVRPVATDNATLLPNHKSGDPAVHSAVAHDASLPLSVLAASSEESGAGRRQQNPAPIAPPVITTPTGSEKVEQQSPGNRTGATLVASFDGLGVGFVGPQGMANLRNPSDNSLAVGPDHIMQTVNTRLAIFSRKGKKYDATGKPLYGPVPNNTVFKGFAPSGTSAITSKKAKRIIPVKLARSAFRAAGANVDRSTKDNQGVVHVVR